jgi:hypothetical protein
MKTTRRVIVRSGASGLRLLGKPPSLPLNARAALPLETDVAGVGSGYV